VDHPEIGRELKVSELKPRTVVVTHADHSPEFYATMWVRHITATWVLLEANVIGMELLLLVQPDDTLQDGKGHPIHVYEYLGKV
jgi:hypothetical protein